MLDDRQKQAAAAIAEGKTLEEVSGVISRTPRAILKWAESPEFQARVLRGVQARAVVLLAQYANGEVDAKVGQAALATLRWLGAGKPSKPPRDPGVWEEEDTDLPEFSEENYSAEQLERLKGGD